MAFKEFPRPKVEPTSRWVRVRFADQWIADTRRAQLLLEYGPGRLPTYFVPLSDVRTEALVDRQDGEEGVTWGLRADGLRVEQAAWTRDLPGLADHVTFSWKLVDWYEEEEQVFVHARDPHKRVDVLRSSRHVRVEVDDQVLADTKRPSVLFETWLPDRYYIPAGDVRMDLLERSDTVTWCPYKGRARYWSARVGDRLVPDIAWSYPDPIPENPKIRDLIAFYNERVDLTVDGERLERPTSPWS